MEPVNNNNEEEISEVKELEEDLVDSDDDAEGLTPFLLAIFGTNAFPDAHAEEESSVAGEAAKLEAHLQALRDAGVPFIAEDGIIDITDITASTLSMEPFEQSVVCKYLHAWFHKYKEGRWWETMEEDSCSRRAVLVPAYSSPPLYGLQPSTGG